MSTASVALISFVIVCFLVWLFFRPNKGWYYDIIRLRSNDDRTIAEDILKFLYHDQETEGYTDIETIEEEFDISKSKLEKIIEDLEAHHLIINHRGLLELTPDGNNYALRIIRVHRLYEKYLAERTGYDETDWHDKAEIMEHKLTEYETNQLALDLGMPVLDPHGDPIPDKYGEVRNHVSKPLTALPIDHRGRVVHIEDEPLAIYQQILAEKIHVGSQILMIENTPQRVVFHSAGEEIVMAPLIAKNITITEVDKEELDLHDVIRLSALQPNENAEIIKINSNIRGLSRRRLLDLGFVKGSKVSVDLKNPLGDPTAYRIKEAAIALRENMADNILIRLKNDD